MESTYGDRTHDNHGNIERQLADVIAANRGRRRQSGHPHLRHRAGAGTGLLSEPAGARQRIPSVPVFLDSPMAADVTEIFRRHRDCFDAGRCKANRAGRSPLGFPGLTIVRSVEQSKAINRRKEPAIIMATNGMCTAGRIKHHLAQYIDRAGVQHPFRRLPGRRHARAGNSRGQREVRMHGRQRLVRARVEQIGGFSGHADRDGPAGLAAALHDVRPSNFS